MRLHNPVAQAGFSRRLGVFCLLLLAFGSSAVSAAVINTAQPFLGVTHYQIIEADDGSTLGAGLFNLPRPVVINIMEIDPTAPGVSFLMQPGNGAAPGEVTRSTTGAFVNSVGAQIGINGDFYDTSPPYTPSGGNYYTDVVHTGVSNGVGYSPSSSGNEHIFNISSDNVARVLTSGGAGTYTTDQGVTLYNAIGGNQRLVQNGTNVTPGGSYTTALNPHTAIGVTFDGHVILMTVDGRQGTYSSGMRTDEMADLLINYFNVRAAINLDGGGSTTMVMDDSNDGLSNSRTINSPSDGGTAAQAGYQRLVANNFAVFATPNPGYVPLPQPARPSVPGPVPVLTELTLFDEFEGSKGHFTAPPSQASISQNIAASSASVIDTQHAHQGTSSLRLDIDSTGATPERMQLRFISGGSFPTNNVHGGMAMGDEGYVGFFLRLEPGADPLYVSIVLDDGSVVRAYTEQSQFRPVIADGGWHLYQFDLGDDLEWDSFQGGDGEIGGPNAFIDAIYFSSAPGNSGGSNWSGSIWLDTVAYNPNGDLSSLVPEPGSAAVALLGFTGLMRRNRGLTRFS